MRKFHETIKGGHLSKTLLSQNKRTIMKKVITVLDPIELTERLMEGKRVEGVLYYDKETKSLTFKSYKRTRPKYVPDRLIHRTEHGWVKESAERIKLHESIPKVLGAPRVLTIIDREVKESKQALVDRELDLIEFC